MGKPGRKKLIDETFSHISLHINKEDKDFIDKFAKETYRDITSTIKLAINDLRNKYNEKGAKHGM